MSGPEGYHRMEWSVADKHGDSPTARVVVEVYSPYSDESGARHIAEHMAGVLRYVSRMLGRVASSGQDTPNPGDMSDKGDAP